MKNLLALAAMLLLFGAGEATAQTKIAYFNSEAIMKQLPDAQDAQKQLDQFVAEWQQELNKMQTEWKNKFDDYDKRKLIMTEQRRADAERELREMDQKIVDFRTQKFGQNGELFNKQNELMKPVQDRVFKAVQDIAREEGYDYVFDKSGDILLMYANEKYDLTQKVYEKLKVPTTAPSSAK
ncbi:MAG: OmpH family outer membrane protein [Ignavibacteriae bacterium]|nr:MAG: OmpH family outer membrane protein [Ignavibacteriota bacterium]